MGTAGASPSPSTSRSQAWLDQGRASHRDQDGWPPIAQRGETGRRPPRDRKGLQAQPWGREVGKAQETPTLLSWRPLAGLPVCSGGGPSGPGARSGPSPFPGRPVWYSAQKQVPRIRAGESAQPIPPDFRRQLPRPASSRTLRHWRHSAIPPPDTAPMRRLAGTRSSELSAGSGNPSRQPSAGSRRA